MPSCYRGHIVGQKPPLKPREVWSIRTRLQVTDAKRDLALFNLAIDSKLRGCDLVAITVGDIALSGNVRDMRRTKASLIYKKTGSIRAVQLLLGHTKLESTVRYLGIEVDDALAISEQVEL